MYLFLFWIICKCWVRVLYLFVIWDMKLGKIENIIKIFFKVLFE